MIDLRTHKQRDQFIAQYGRLPSGKDWSDFKSIKGLYKKNKYAWTDQVAERELLKIISKNVTKIRP